jgi:hypothetical protein
MQHDITHILTDLINGTLPLRQVHFANSTSLNPELALQVDFPRLEIVIEGSVEDRAGCVLRQGDVLCPAGGWNNPQWQAPATTLSILFGKQQLGFSLLHWDGVDVRNLTKQHVARRGPRIGSFLYRRSMKCRCNRMSSKPRG